MFQPVFASLENRKRKRERQREFFPACLGLCVSFYIQFIYCVFFFLLSFLSSPPSLFLAAAPLSAFSLCADSRGVTTPHYYQEPVSRIVCSVCTSTPVCVWVTGQDKRGCFEREMTWGETDGGSLHVIIVMSH